MNKLTFACLTLLFFFTGIQLSLAQSDFGRVKMDSLRRILLQQKSIKDSVLILQKMVDITPIVSGETAGYPDYLKKLLELNKKSEVIDSGPYQLLSDGNAYWRNKQYRQALVAMQGAVSDFDKQHKVIYPLLLNMRILYNLMGDQENRLHYYHQKLEYYQVNGPYQNMAPCYHAIAGYYYYKGAYNLSTSNYMRGAEIIKNIDLYNYVNAMSVVGNIYGEWGNTKKAAYYLALSAQLAKKIKDNNAYQFIYYSQALVAFKNQDYNKALEYINEATNYTDKKPNQRRSMSQSFQAQILLKLGQPALALPIIARIKLEADSAGFKTVSNFGYMELDYDFYLYYLSQGNTASAEKSLLDGLHTVIEEKSVYLQVKYLKELAYFYQKQNKTGLSARYFDEYVKALETREKGLDVYKVSQYEIDLNDKVQRDHITQLKQEKAVQDYQISRRNALLWGSLVVVLLISALLVFIYRQLSINKKTLISLRQTQRQLIQSEKMASLGELTAGIAHEIQNPLNFVNNFSEVSIELLEEMEAELKLGQVDDAIDRAGDVKQNLEKISHHGKRADGIVKGMLQHSRASSNQKEPTDINVLADEYFRLAYHGLRAKDKSFNAELVTDLAENLPKAAVVPQDIGRVLLNLFNNAFYAVTQKAKTAGSDYKPTVELTTIASPLASGGGGLEIRVKDNGNGIPEHIKDKIMQPFFTTKPTGEGTGLGLSMSYDIVVKGHGGSITVNSTEGEGSEFILKLTIN